MTRPRRILPGATYLLTRRSLQRELLFVPRGRLEDIFGYCLGLAAQKHGIQVHAAVVLSNHWHGVVTDPDGRICSFVQDFHGFTARAVNRELGRCDSVWSGGRPSMVRLVGAETVMDKLVYTLTNVVAARLVRTHDDWPGLHTSPRGVVRAPMRFERPPGFFRSDGVLPEVVELPVTVPPPFAHLSADEFARELSERVRARERSLGEAAQRRGETFLGRRRVLSQRRDARPSKPETRSDVHPTLACSDPTRRAAELEELADFHNAYRAAYSGWTRGDRSVVFPFGTLLLVERHGARSRPPPPWLRQAA